MNSSNLYKLEEIIQLTGITPRNIKFWCDTYNIKPKKIGRNNFYSEQQLQILNFIKLMTETSFFTQKFIKLIVDLNLQPNNDIIKTFSEFRDEINNLTKNSDKLLTLNFNIINLNDVDISKNKAQQEKQEMPQPQLSSKLPKKSQQNNNDKKNIKENDSVSKIITPDAQPRRQDSFLL
ncbi:MAG TPA: helix-turn-helix domain-containing protein [bacterium]|nr:helix-turn-helix domain-containing protein [bacterium]